MNDGLKEINEPLEQFLETEGCTPEMAQALESKIKIVIGDEDKAHRALMALREEGCVPSDNKLLSELAKNVRSEAMERLDKSFKPANSAILSAMREYGDNYAMNILRAMLKPPRTKRDIRDTGLPDSRAYRVSKGRAFHRIDQCFQPDEKEGQLTSQMDRERSVIRDYLDGTGVFEASVIEKPAESTESTVSTEENPKT